MDITAENLFRKLKNKDALTEAEIEACLKIFGQDAVGKAEHTEEFGIFHYLTSAMTDISYAHEVQHIRQNYIHVLRQQRSRDTRRLSILYIHCAEYYYSIQVYSECIRYLFAVLENKNISSHVLSAATTILFSVLTQSGLYDMCRPYIDRLQRSIAEDPPTPMIAYIQELAFMQIYGFMGETEKSEACYQMLLNTDPLPQGIGPAELAYQELLHLGIEAAAKEKKGPDETYILRLRDVCGKLAREADVRDSDYASTIVPILNFILPKVSKSELLELFSGFMDAVYSAFDKLALYTFLFEEAGFAPEDAPEQYEKYIEMLKVYYRTNVTNRRQVIENEIQAQTMEAEFRRQAMTDRLTGLGNRQAYTEIFQEYADSVDPPEPNLCFVMMDLDTLKKQNDTFGHEAGDQLLRAAAQAVRKAFGEDAELFRYGGDEFVALLRTTKDGVEERLASLEKVFHEWSRSEENRYGAELSVSAGYAFGAEINRNQSNAERLRELCRLADSRMYIVKHIHHQRLI